MRRIAITLLLAACAKTPAGIDKQDLAEMPRLPAPRAGTYARVYDTPKDPVVASVMGDRAWEAYLSGAAAGLALRAATDSGGFTRREVREQAWQAGYAYPIVSLGAWPTAEQGSPPREVSAWLAAQPTTRDIGLVRARGAGKDLWVGLAGEPMLDLGIIPRELKLGQQVSLPEHRGTTWWAADGDGAVRTGTLDQAHMLRLDVRGEWVFYLADKSGELARFPVYVDELAPRTGVLPTLNVSIGSSDQATARASQLMDLVRDAYGAPALTDDPLLDSAATLLLDRSADRDEVLSGVGTDPAKTIVWRCRSTSVEDCVDQAVWDPRHRAAFVRQEPWSGAVAAKWSPGEVELVGVMSPAE